MSEQKYEVVWPLGRSVSEAVDQAPPLSDLNDKTVCFLWNGVFRGHEIFPVVAEELKKKFPKVNIIDEKTMGVTHGLDEREYLVNLPDRLRGLKADAVVSAMGA